MPTKLITKTNIHRTHKLLLEQQAGAENLSATQMLEKMIEFYISLNRGIKRFKALSTGKKPKA